MSSLRHAMPVVLVLAHAVLALALQGAAAGSGEVPAVIVFGDSTADTGNNNFIQTVARGNYAPYGRDYAGGVATGRFSNGLLPADLVSEALGLPPSVPAYLDPSHTIHHLASGVSFASAGSGLDNITAQIPSAMTLGEQIDHFRQYTERLRRARGEAAARRIIAGALYIFSIGASDFLQNYLVFPVRGYSFTPPEYEAYLVGAAEAAVRAVHGLGARAVTFAGLPPLGCLPLERAVNLHSPGDCNGAYNMAAVSFNRRLEGMLGRLGRELPGARVAYVDQYGLLSAMIARPWEYGFENSAQGCCGSGTGYVETGGALWSLESALACDDAGKYVFFDAVHPSERAYRMIAGAILNATSHPRSHRFR
ncbi:GDSL esterase/lipase At2g04570-like [Triticum urartu]|uniref:GDSL esterase/lipase n=1 Tax=Triticum urartu TaxID=4572 RepID=A0A8R7QEI3_TRIUA|nr:GDSL esterase/lipase At2g04570-like [Triticum urartu]XP_048529650.1 GDSL esterase/lipase At2g04570-like [Triticum urartu]